MPALDRIERICGRELQERALRAALIEEIRARVPCAAFVWLLTDPETCVGSAPLAETPALADLPRLIRAKYLTTVNRWTSLAAGASATLVEATGSDRSRSRMWAELLAGYGVDDVLSTVFRDQYGCWGFLDLWRRSTPFTAGERDLLGRVAQVVTPALRRSLLATFGQGPSGPLSGDQGPSGPLSGDEGQSGHLSGEQAPTPGGSRAEPVLLLLSEDLEPVTQTAPADAYLRALLPTDADRSPVPAGAYNVAAQLLAQEDGVDGHPATARVHLGGGGWVTLRAARMPGPPAGIAVSIEPTTPAERTALYARVAGLSEREAELLAHLVGGSDTRELARRLFVSEHTVQDHLKSVFAKTGAANRRVLVARATGAG